ncbi:phage holin family protein [Herbiconiux sp. SYSU D00978]|uniref:phage holin family protein n=1 Tax=Herbiconiux sp. SYSU D00978 TaxID=2812562 RepID=UPI001A958192|nr:phage holin family protein [Herbiconiux sp. SYSU D00978]
MTESGSRPYPDPAEEKASRTSLGALLGEVTKDISTLFRQEVALAKAEVTESGKKAGKGAGLFAGAGVAGHFTLLFLSIALWWALGYLVGNAWSALIVAVIWGIVALVLALQGRKEFQKIKGAPQTAETIREIPETFK